MKNNNPITIDQARTLLEKFYAASTSPAEEAALRDFFSEADAAALPPDMVADRALFKAMGAAHHAVPPMPADLESTLDARIEALAGGKGSAWRSRHVLYWLSAAVAAAVLALILAFPFLVPDSGSPVDGAQWMVARNDSVVLPIFVPGEIEERQAEVAQVQPEQAKSEAPLVRHPRKEILDREPETVMAGAQDDFSMEITDPKAALTFARRSLSLVAMATKTATCHVSEILDEK